MVGLGCWFTSLPYKVYSVNLKASTTTKNNNQEQIAFMEQNVTGAHPQLARDITSRYKRRPCFLLPKLLEQFITNPRQAL
jgi:hypothetical protein